MARKILRPLAVSGLLVLVGTAIVALEMRQDAVQNRLPFFALIALFLAVLTAGAPKRLRSVVLVVASLAFGLTCIEALAIWKEPKTDVAANLETGARVPIIGWDNLAPGTYPARKTNLQTGAPVYDVIYTIGAQRERLTLSNRTGRSIVFFGDSFTFGEGVNDADTMPQQFADLLDRRQKVVNLGVGGFSPAQVLAELQTGIKDDVIGKAPAAFVMLTSSFHVSRTACKDPWTIRAPRFERNEGRLDLVGSCSEGTAADIRRFLERTASYRVFVKPFRQRINRRDIETYIDIVAEVSRTAKAKYGVETVVPYIGGPVTAPKALRHQQMKLLTVWAYLEGTGYDDDKIIAELRARGVKVVDMTLRDEVMSGHVISIAGDGHPTPWAHKRRAEMTLAALEDAGVPLIGLPQAPERLSEMDR